MLQPKASDFSLLWAISARFQPSTIQLVQSFAQKQVAPLSILAVLGLTSISWLATSVIAPQIAQAYTATVNIAVSSQPGESYRSFLRRAESIARAAAQRSFDRDILVTQVAVTIVGQNDGAIAPILALEVSRQSWRRRPDPQRWATYFPNTQSLLRFDETNLADETPNRPTPTSGPGASPSRPPASRVIQLPGGVQVIPNPVGTPQQNGAPTQQNGAPTQRNGAPTQRNGAPTQQNGAPTQQNGAPNQATPSNAPQPGTAPGQVIQLPGGVRLIPNPGGGQ